MSDKGRAVKHRDNSPIRTIALAIPVLLIAIVGIVLLGGVQSVQSDELCLLVRNGEIDDEWGPGLHWHFVPSSDTTCFRTSRLTYEASPGERGAGADYNEPPVDTYSNDGQRIDAVSFRISFRIPQVFTTSDGDVIDENNLRTIFTDVGARSEDDLVSSVVGFYARPTVRAVMQLHSSNELLQGDLNTVSQEIEDRLRPIFAEHGIVLEDLLVSKADFNDVFEAKLQQQQMAAIDYEIQQEQTALTDQQIQARIDGANADATVVAIQAGAEANRTTTLANAEATAVAIGIAAYGSSEVYLAALHIQSMSGWPVQIVGDSDVMPVNQVQLSSTPTATPLP